MSSYSTRSTTKRSREGDDSGSPHRDSVMSPAKEAWDDTMETEAVAATAVDSNQAKTKNDTNKAGTAARSSKPIARKRRRKDVSVLLDHDAVGLIMAFVGHQELLSFALSSQTLQEKLTMTMVVKSAFISGKKDALMNIKALKSALASRGVHVPSPFRVLQLVNGKRCEVCNKSAQNMPRRVLRYGLYSCQQCLDTSLKTNVMSFDCVGRMLIFLTKVRAEGRICVSLHTETDPMSEIDSTTLQATFYRRLCRGGEVAGPIATPEIFETIRQQETHVGKSWRNIVDEALDYNPASTDSYQEFMNAFEAGEKLGEEADVIRREQRKQNTLKVARKRLANLDSSLEKLKGFLSPAIKGFALNREADENFVATFTCPFVDRVLREAGFVRAPTKISDETLEEVASILNQKFESLQDVDFISAKCLPANNRFYVQVKPLFLEAFPDLQSLAMNLTDEVFDLIEEGQLVKALFIAAKFPFHTAEFGCKMLAGLPSLKSVRDTRVDMAELTGAHWRVCYLKPNRQKVKPSHLFKLAYQSFNHMVSMVNAFLLWARAKTKLMKNENREEDIKAIYGAGCLRQICEGRFDLAYNIFTGRIPRFLM